MVTVSMENVVRQVDDSLLWQQTIAASFNHTAEYLTLLGRNGILQNPEKFQFCHKEVDWSGFRIEKGTVAPMPHILGIIRDFPTPVIRTDLRSFMALVQQVSFGHSFGSQAPPFREFLKETVPWH
jgi:hypothetical protein